MTLRAMYDAVNPSAIPLTAQVVAGYVNGRYKWSGRDWDRFPLAEKVGIAVYIPGKMVPNDGLVLDVEANDAPSPAAQQQAKIWVALRRAAGIRPCIYTSASTAHYFANLGVDFWLADYTAKPHLIPGTVATQWTDTGKYDLSVVADGWPYPLPLKGANTMAVPVSPCVTIKVTKSGKGYWLVGTDGGVFAYGDAGFFGSMGGKPLAAPIVEFAPMPNEDGYYMVAQDYGVFAYGSAKYLGHPE